MTLLPQTLVNIRFSGQADPLVSPLVLSKVADVERELAGEGRVLLRQSGTEPLLRVMVEGRCAETIARCANLLPRLLDS
jgi:phosphoglucosamine mutase